MNEITTSIIVYLFLLNKNFKTGTPLFVTTNFVPTTVFLLLKMERKERKKTCSRDVSNTKELLSRSFHFISVCQPDELSALEFEILCVVLWLSLVLNPDIQHCCLLHSSHPQSTLHSNDDITKYNSFKRTYSTNKKYWHELAYLSLHTTYPNVHPRVLQG